MSLLLEMAVCGSVRFFLGQYLTFHLGTAAQIVPALMKEAKVKSLTQIIRTQHWIFPVPNFSYPRILQCIFRYVPFTLQLHRFHIFLMAENDFRLFPTTKGAAKLRQKRRKDVEKYMRKAGPEKYHDLLIPDFDVGCKVRLGRINTMFCEKTALTVLYRGASLTPDTLRLCTKKTFF